MFCFQNGTLRLIDRGKNIFKLAQVKFSISENEPSHAIVIIMLFGSSATKKHYDHYCMRWFTELMSAVCIVPVDYAYPGMPFEQ